MLMEHQIPPLLSDEVLIRVDVVSLSEEDLHLYEGKGRLLERIKHFPRVIGHEFSGHVVEVGEAVTRFAPGDPVSADSQIACLTCCPCARGKTHLCANPQVLGVDRDGCFADYIMIPQRNLWKNDPKVPAGIAAIQETIASAVHATLVEPVGGQQVLILGDRPECFLAASVARASGASHVFMVGVRPSHLEMGRRMGADRVFDATKISVMGSVLGDASSTGVDVVIEMSGNPGAIAAGLSLLRNGGRFSACGVSQEPVTLNLKDQIIHKGLRLYGVHGRKVFETWFQMAGLLNSGRINPTPLITHSFALSDFEKGFHLLSAGSEEGIDTMKVLIYLNAQLLKEVESQKTYQGVERRSRPDRRIATDRVAPSRLNS